MAKPSKQAAKGRPPGDVDGRILFWRCRLSRLCAAARRLSLPNRCVIAFRDDLVQLT